MTVMRCDEMRINAVHGSIIGFICLWTTCCTLLDTQKKITLPSLNLICPAADASISHAADFVGTPAYFRRA